MAKWQKELEKKSITTYCTSSILKTQRLQGTEFKPQSHQKQKLKNHKDWAP
jgi:hypothetical protein